MLEQTLRRVKRNLDDWRRSLEDPAGAQETLYGSLLNDYERTEYGQRPGGLPVAKYSELEPWIERVMNGDYDTLLAEKPITWVMTRGTTGDSKIIPVTPRHLDHLVRGGSRAVLNHTMREGWRLSPAAC